MGRMQKKSRARAWHIIAFAAVTACANARAEPASDDPESEGAGATDTEQGQTQGSAPSQAAPTTQPPQKWGTYTENFGYRIANTDLGTANLSIYTYVRYLNQKGTDSTYKDAFGDVTTLQERQEFQLLKVQIKFLGWLFDEKFRYFLYAWSSNASQGQGAQVVLAGNLNYEFNDHFTLSGGIRSLPGTRSVEGNFPFWLNVDNRMMADEFFRPSYTDGIWAQGEIIKGLRYQVMLGNNLSTLGVNSGQLNNKIDTLSSALIWMPSTGEFGPGFGDFENHANLATRLALHYTHSIEDKQSQPNTDAFENTQIRLSDGTVVFTPNIFGPGVTVNEIRYQMSTLDAGVKYRGYALEGEYYWRRLDKFEGPGTAGLPRLHDTGFQLQASMMPIQKTLQVYLAGSKIYGQYGNPWDTRVGMNWFLFKNRVVRWNTQVMYMYHSPVGYNSLTYNVGSTGVIFNTDLELAL
jgi:hypothetical protein